MEIIKSKDYILTFGKYKDRRLEEIPLKYLNWLIGIKPDDKKTRAAVDDYLSDPVIAKELEKQLNK